MIKKAFSISLLIGLVFFSCKKNQINEPKLSQEISYDTYSSDWEDINKMEKNGLGKSIIIKTDSLLSKALRTNNITQIFKALAYRSKYSNNIEEEATLKILNNYEARIEEAEFPLKQLLHSATAELYFQYYNQNRWRFNQRTTVTNFDEKDIRSWSLDKILSVVKEHYLVSLNPVGKLSQFPTSSLKTILLSNEKETSRFDENEYKLRPSLYDFLADRALHYFKKNEGRVTKPIQEFDIEDYPIFSYPSKFSKLKLKSIDSLSNPFLTAKIYQSILTIHQIDESPNVFIDFELDRLQHYYYTSKNELKDSLYLNALNKLSSQYSLAYSADEIDFKIAELYFQLGSKFNNENPDDKKKWYIKQAYEICKNKEQLNSFGAEQCKALLKDIESSSLSFQAEDTYIPNQAILYRLQYKNIKQAFFRLVKIPHNQIPEKNRIEFLSQLIDSRPLRNWEAHLPIVGDFRQHSVELYTEGLSIGNYFLLACSDSTFNLKENHVAFANIEISSLSYISRQTTDGNSIEIFVKDRESGNPIKNAEITAFSNKYNYSSRNRTLEKIGHFKTNNDGYLKFSTSKQNENISFSINTLSDTISRNSNYYLYSRSKEVRKSVRAHIYTDRAIYRPGQTIFFKVIYIESNGKAKTPKANYTNEISLHSVNGEKLKYLTTTSNQYGSVQGSFILPSSGLNGKYRIQTKHGSQYISVEEYKRPTFYIEIDSSKAQNRINENITVTGKVESFSGIALSHSQLKYRVVRKATYPSWSSYRSFLPPTNEKEIANGIKSTDENGHFEIQFLAKADPIIKSKWSPKYHYQVIIEASNLQGETQSLNHSIKLSNQAVYLSSSIGDNIQLNMLKDILIQAKNIDGYLIDANASISLWKLKTPSKPKKRKHWRDSDQSIISESEYEEKLPSYPKSDEGSLGTFSKDFKVANSLIECNKPIRLFNDIKPGAYELNASTTDQFGNVVNWKKRFILYDKNSETPPYPIFSWLNTLKNEIEVGDTAKILFASSLKNLKLLFEIEHENKIVKQQWLTFNEEQKLFEIPIMESYRGGIAVHFTAIHSDRMIQLSQTIKVPFSNKKLKVKLATFRDKTTAGSNEKWSMTVADLNNEGLNTELLASMYDQSLDQFAKKDWGLNLYNQNNPQLKWNINQSFLIISSESFSNKKTMYPLSPKHSYPRLNWFGFRLGYGHSPFGRKSIPMLAESMSADVAINKVAQTNNDSEYETFKEKEPLSEIKKETPKQNHIRSDFRETVFFYPQLKTNKKGELSFEFIMPDALTQWKFRALAHTQDLKIGAIEKSIISQKELMLIPNTPRFFREGDEFLFKAMISNLSSNQLSGYAKLRFFNAVDEHPIDIFPQESADVPFELAASDNKIVSWKIKIPKGIEAIRYEIIAESQEFSDGEEKVIPVLKNKKLVTESLPLWIRGNESKTFSFEKLLASNTMKDLSHESFTLEFTPNPAWYAIQALPALSENGNECSEQVFARLYANSLAEKIANKHPKIKSVFDQWKSLNSNELTSKLMQNQELKSILIEETPWLKRAQNESEQKHRIALLFDYNRMAQEKSNAINKLIQLQLPNGGWGWYKGMRDNRYITQYIIEGIGHLIHLGADVKNNPKFSQMVLDAIKYLDNRILEDYLRLIERKADLRKNHLSSLQVHYLYTRSFFKEFPFPKDFKAFDYYLKQAEQFWIDKGLYEQGMIALAINRWKNKSEIPQNIINSLTDNALIDDKMGMYWKKNSGGYYWNQSTIETQALLIELYKEMKSSSEVIEELKIWLLKQKQTQAWSNSKATAKACYALFLDNASLLNVAPKLNITVGEETLNLSSKEPGTAYFKKVWRKASVNDKLGNINIEKKDNGIAWGAAYWQYYQDLDKITSTNESGLKLTKKLFKYYLTEKGESMKPIDVSEIKVGDKIKVRIVLETDINLEFVHLKDMRASAFEPINVISKYKFQDGLGYYESTKDASTNFFIDWLPKGLYVFEYTLRASQEGDFSNGISSIQCQYAPEFSSHSEGRRIKIVTQ